MSELPLFTTFQAPAHAQWFRALQASGPRRAWQLMDELRALDEPFYLAQSEPTVEELTTRTTAFMEQLPALPTERIPEEAARFADYGPRLQFEATFIHLWLKDRRVLFDEVVDASGQEHLAEAKSHGRGVLLLPLHIGPSYAAIPLAAHFTPVKTLFNKMNFDEIKAWSCPDLEVQGMQLGSANAAMEAVRVLRQGDTFCMFPEMDPRHTTDQHHVPVPFLGSQVLAPVGPIALSKMAGAPMLPVVLRTAGPGRFDFRFLAPLAPPRSREDMDARLLQLWELIEHELLRDHFGDWEMWFSFDKMFAGRRPELVGA